MIRESRLTALERIAEPEREVLRRNRKILLSAIPEIMEKLRVTEAEAWRMLPQVCPPEVAALAADDWETNPLTLDLFTLKSISVRVACSAPLRIGKTVRETLFQFRL